MDYGYLERNLREARERMKRALEAAGRTDDVTLVAAVKSAEVDEINYLHDVLGVNDIGENRVQQLMSRYDQLHRDGLNIHFIGSLQTNKVKYIIDKVCMIQSVDSLKLAAEIDRQAKKHGIKMNILVEINSGEEENKGGVSPEDAAGLCAGLAQFDSLKLCGFMTMAPRCDKKEDYNKYFAQTYKLVLDIWTKKLHNIDRPVISMGMSESYEEAIAEGATEVRIGRSLFAK